MQISVKCTQQSPYPPVDKLSIFVAEELIQEIEGDRIFLRHLVGMLAVAQTYNLDTPRM